MTYRLFILPDDADASVEDFTTLDAAVGRGVKILSWEDSAELLAELNLTPAKAAELNRASLSAFRHVCLGDAGSIYIEKR